MSDNMTKSFSEKGYDVLIYLSDQHTADCAGFMGDAIVRTPNLDRIAKDSFVFHNAYTSCPLCVPARASFLTSRMPSNIGVFDNSCDFKSSEVTFAHTHALKGYDCTLIGRMHFVGLDYFHGFTNRIGKDMTPSYWGCPSEERKDLGDFGRSLYQKHCLEVVGGGDSPVLSYDREIVDHALSFYDEEHENPQMTVVGTYGPHFPYVGPEEKMPHYRKIFAENYADESMFFDLPPVDAKVQNTTKEDIIELRSAYYAMVETLDEQVGLVYDAYTRYLSRTGRKGIFIYMSDHGDQLGCMGIYGKQTFFEKSAKIPLVMKVDDFSGRDITEPVSIMDIAPTLCEINGTAEIPLAEGNSFFQLLAGEPDPSRYVLSEYYDNQIAECIRGYMVYKGHFKYIMYAGFEDKELLFDLRKTESERNNVSVRYPEICHDMRNIIETDERIKNHTREFLDNKKQHKLLDKVGRKQHYLNRYLYSPPEESRFIAASCKRPHRDGWTTIIGV